MKTYKKLFDKIISTDNISKAIESSAKKKRERKDVVDILNDKPKHITKIQTMLTNRTWKPRMHEASLINDGTSQKPRIIIRPDYAYEQIVHHCVVQVLIPMFTKGMYEYSCGSIPGRGATLGKNYIKKFIEKNNINNPPKGCKWNKSNIKYVLKIDIKHFFENVDINLLKQKFARAIKDDATLWLIDTILNSNIATYKGQTICVGLPIGYYTSQWFANWYLQDLDHFIKEQLHVLCYVRYMDDMIMFGRNKRELRKHLERIRVFLKGIGLTLKSNYQIFRFDYIGKDGKRRGRCLDFIGFKFYRDKIVLRKAILYKATQKAAKIKKKRKITWYDGCQVISYMGYFKHSDTYKIREKYVASKISVKACKKLISKHSKAINLKKKEKYNKIEIKGEKKI